MCVGNEVENVTTGFPTTDLFRGLFLSNNSLTGFFIFNLIVLTSFFICILVSTIVYPYKRYFSAKNNYKFNIFCIFISNLGNPRVFDLDVGFSYKYLIFNIAIIFFGVLSFPLYCSFFIIYGRIRFLGYGFSGLSSLGTILIGIFHQDLIGDKVHVSVTVVASLGLIGVFITLFVLETQRFYSSLINEKYYFCKWVSIIALVAIIILTSCSRSVQKRGLKHYGDQFRSKLVEWNVIIVAFIWLYIQSFFLIDYQSNYFYLHS